MADGIWFAWRPVRLGFHGKGPWVWLRRVFRHQDGFYLPILTDATKYIWFPKPKWFGIQSAPRDKWLYCVWDGEEGMRRVHWSADAWRDATGLTYAEPSQWLAGGGVDRG